MLTGCLYTPRIRTVGGTSWAEGFFTGGDTPPPVMPDLIGCPFPLPPSPLGLARGSGAMIPYFGGASRLAFARMTAGEVLPAVDFFTGGDLSYPLKAVFMLPGCLLSHT